MMENKIEIPDGVVNKKAYYKYIALVNHPILKNKYIDTSDGGVVNIAMATQNFRRYIGNLSPKEQETLLNMKTRYNKLLMKKNASHAIAFGSIGRRKKNLNALSAFEGDVVELLGRMFTVAEVVKIMGEDNEVITNEDEVRAVLKKNIVEVERKREEFRNKVADVRLYNKRPRLEELAWMYSKMKMRYISLNSVEAYNAMLRTLEQLRKESEGDVINVNGAIDMNINVEINAHIQKEILKTINLKEIILGRISARMQYDPAKLIAGLHNSYYNKFVQISGDFDPNAQMNYPSLINYDFNDIEVKNENKDSTTDLKPEPITETEHSKAQSVKELFLKKIREQRKKTEERTSAYNEELSGHENPKTTDDYTPINRFKVRKSNFAVAKDKVPPSKTKGGKRL